MKDHFDGQSASKPLKDGFRGGKLDIFTKNAIFSHFIYIFYSKSVHRIVPVSTFVVFLLLTTLEWKSLIFATRTFHELTQGLFEMRNITFYKIV